MSAKSSGTPEGSLGEDDNDSERQERGGNSGPASHYSPQTACDDATEMDNGSTGIGLNPS